MGKLKDQKGVAAVEFALVLPILVVLAFGIIEFSLALYDKAVITNASREGARAGIVFSVPPVTDAQIGDVVTTYCQNRMISLGSPNSVTTQVSGGGGTAGEALTVQVDYQYTFLLLPGFISSLTSGINLSAVTVMRME